MPTTTPELELPRPEPTDDADVPTDLINLTDKLEELLADGDLALAATGDFKMSARNASHGRWLLCDGRELTQAEIEAELGLAAGKATALAALLGTGPGSAYGEAAVGKIQLPDPRGRVAVGAGAGAGLTARARGDQFGSEGVLLTPAQGSVRDHGHGAGALLGPVHQHGAGLLKVPPHKHTNYFSSLGNGHEDSRGTSAGPYFCAMEGHTHPIVGDTLNSAQAAVTGSSADGGNGAVTGATAAVTQDHHASNGDAAEEAHPNIQPSLALGNFFIRV